MGKYRNHVRIDVLDFRRSPDPRFLPYNTARYRILCSSYNWFSRDSLWGFPGVTNNGAVRNFQTGRGSVFTNLYAKTTPQTHQNVYR